MRAGTLLGAGGATAYYNGVDVSGTVRSLLLSPSGGGFPAWQQRNGAGSAGGGKELESLYRLVRAHTLLQAAQTARGSARRDRSWGAQVEQLAKDVHRQQGVTISMAHSRTCAPSHRFHPVRSSEESVPLCKRPTSPLSAGLLHLHQTDGAACCTEVEV